MPLVNVVLVLIVAGVLMWLVNRYIPMQGTIKGILNAVVVIVVVIWLLNVFGSHGHYQPVPCWSLTKKITGSATKTRVDAMQAVHNMEE